MAVAPGGALTSTPAMLNQCSKVIAPGTSTSATWSPCTRYERARDPGWLVSPTGGSSMWNVMARLDCGAAAKAMGSEIYSAPAGIVTLGSFENVSARSVPASIWGEDAEAGRAMCTDVRWRGAVPNAFEMCTRTTLPPIERCTIWRRVASRRSPGSSELPASGTCSDAAHDPTQFGPRSKELAEAA